MEGMSGGISRSKDGVPGWSGDAASFQDYEEQALQWEQSVDWKKRYLCGPKLVGELSGTARKLVVGKRADWVSWPGGVQHLLDFLRQCLGKPKLPELSELLNSYFKSSQRKKLETMNDYIVRKSEIYSRARQAMERVQRHYEGGSRWSRAHQSSTGPDEVDGQGEYPQWSWGDWWTHHPDEEGETEQPGTQGPIGSGRAVSERSYQSARSEGRHWGGRQQWSDTWWPSHAGGSEEAGWTRSSPELLPEFLQGWYLLMDAGLDGHERNMIQTAVNGDFSNQRIAQELRAQWPDEELKRRDQAGRHASYWSHGDQEADYEEDIGFGFTAAHLERAGMISEGIALIGEAEEEAEEALAMMEQARRTLKEARAKQHQVKLSRKYYKVTTDGGKGAGKGGPKEGLKCFRCGGPHKIAQCPDRHAPHGQQPKAAFGEKSEEAPFICYTEDDQAMMLNADRGLTTEEAVRKGYAVVDGGATKTLGSTHALEAVMEENLRKYQTGRILEVDTNDKPMFGFGNSSRDQCVSTAKVQIHAGDRDGVLKVHALDKGTGPILLSIATLRSLKAIIDFEEDLIVFRGLDDTKIIKAERSQSGHQLLPLTEDLYKEATTSRRPVPSLRSFLE